MSSGRRYSDEGRKLNFKKVLGVIIAVAVIIMVIISIKKLLDPKTEQQIASNTYYFAAFQNGKWGVINQSATEIIPFTYDEMIIIPNNKKDVFITMTDVNMETGTYKTKAFNKKGEELFTEYDLVEAIDNYDANYNLWYEENVLRVKKDGKYGLINLNGAELLDTKYDNIYSLKGTKNSLILEYEGKIGLSSDVGDIIVPTEYKQVKAAGNDYSNGYIVINSEDKQGLIGTNKKTILDVTYDEIKPVLGNNYYAVKEEGKLKILNEKKETILDEDFDDAKQVDGENIILKRGENFGVINLSKEEKVPFEYQELVGIGSNHLIAKKDNKYGVIDGNNNILLGFDYEYIKQRQDTVFIEADRNLTETEIYNKDFELKLTGIVSEVNSEKGYIYIRIGEEYKYYNFKFEEKSEKDFFPNHTLFLTKENGKYGYKDAKGNLVVDCTYDDATRQNEYGFCSIKKGTVWGSLNKDGNVSVKPSVNLDDYLVVDFIGTWHLGEDLNMYYYER